MKKRARERPPQIKRDTKQRETSDRTEREPDHGLRDKHHTAQQTSIKHNRREINNTERQTIDEESGQLGVDLNACNHHRVHFVGRPVNKHQTQQEREINANRP
jgi:hypothetical protein